MHEVGSHRFAADQTLSFGRYLVQVSKRQRIDTPHGLTRSKLFCSSHWHELERHAFWSHSRIGGNQDTLQGSPSGEPRSGASAHGLFAESHLMQRRDDSHSQLSRNTPAYKALGRLPERYDSSPSPKPPIPQTLTFRHGVRIGKEVLSLLGLSSEPASKRIFSPNP
jgi:hypothetical protein